MHCTRALLLLLAALLLAACATGDPTGPLQLPPQPPPPLPTFTVSQKWIHPQYHALAPRRVAVLLPGNETNIVPAGRLGLYLMAQHLPRRGYHVADPWPVEQFLMQRGVSDGGQLGTWAGDRWNFRADLPAAKLCDDLRAEGLVLGRIGSLVEVIGGYGNVRKVNLGWMITNRDGVMVWRAESTAFSADVHTKRDDAAAAAIGHFLRRLGENVGGTPLFKEMWGATQGCLSTLPPRR